MKAMAREGCQMYKQTRLLPILAAIAALLLCYQAGPRQTSASRLSTPRVVDNATLAGKVIAGYQGWFACPSDQTGVRNWGHWQQANGRLAVDMLPDMSEMPKQQGCEAPFIHDAAGNDVMLFSSQNPFVVEKHVEWLASYGIDGLALQSFPVTFSNRRGKEARDVVLQNIIRASEKNGRFFFIAYDISGAADWLELVKQDWVELTNRNVFASTSYLHQDGLPIVEIWGAGVEDRLIKPGDLSSMIDFFGAKPHAASVVLGVPGGWRQLPQEWLDVYAKARTISPWSVGMYRTAEAALQYERTVFKNDLAFTKAHKMLYMPVVFPGYSAANRSNGKEPFDEVRRDCGAFLDAQIKQLGEDKPDSVYVAMFDEANEGTAIFKTSPKTYRDAQLIALNEPCNAQGDLYLQHVGNIARVLGQGVEIRSR